MTRAEKTGPVRFAGLNCDGRLLFAARIVRMVGYGGLSVILVLYLSALGLDDVRIGILLTLTLVGDAVISLWLTTGADANGRRRVLEIGAGLMVAAGIVFAFTTDFWALVLAATIGVISVSGGETGPFQAVEQASLSHILDDNVRTRVFGWYSLVGSFAAAFGALAAGLLIQALQNAGAATLTSYRAVVIGYALIGCVLLITFGRLSRSIELEDAAKSSIAGRLGLHRSRGIVGRLSALFALDSFGGSLASQSLIAYWFALRFGAHPDLLGAIFFVANILAGLSALVAARISKRIGLVRTMVFTHLPSNAILMALPLMPTMPLAAFALFACFSLSRMDVPARQSYIVAVVDPNERSAAAGVAGIARSVGATPGPLIATPLIGIPALQGLPFLVGGALKISYDLLLYGLFRAVRPPEESTDAPDIPPISS